MSQSISLEVLVSAAYLGHRGRRCFAVFVELPVAATIPQPKSP
jgi:hypothetical protein